MLISDAIAADPRRVRVLMGFGMACSGCPMARFETVEEAATSYGIDPLALASALADPRAAAETEELT
jgi:hybrid cluster-associated redox disulfide protein